MRIAIFLLPRIQGLNDLEARDAMKVGSGFGAMTLQSQVFTRHSLNPLFAPPEDDLQ